ncbi:MAG: ABC transporter permease [Lachnospiraceae bacterium]|nr:ABC transporter permease [Lachnospiraceae bacterium]
MQQSLFIAGKNLKKKKSDAIVLAVMIATSVFLLYVSLSVLLNMDRVVDSIYEKCRTADWYMLNIERNVEGIEDFFASCYQAEEFESTPAYLASSGKYGFDGEADSSFIFLLASAEEKRNICSIYPEYQGTLSEDEILCPYYFRSAFGRRQGDFIWLSFGRDRTYRFQIAGFVEDPLYANPMNMAVYKCYLAETVVEWLKESEPEVISYMEYKVKLREGEDCQEFTKEISASMNQKMPHIDDAFNFSFDWQTMRYGDTMMSKIGIGIAMVFAVLLFMIAMVVLWFCIGNFCEMNLKDIGILKASGYTGRQITQSFVLEMGIVSLIGSAAGLICGGLAGPLLGRLLAAVMGLPYENGFDIFSAVTAFCGSVLLTVVITWQCARRYGKTEILDALRGGVRAHNFRKNYFALHKSRQPLLTALGMKNIFGAKLKNAGIVFVVTLLGFASCTGFYLYQNFVKETDLLMRLIGMEFGHVGITGEDVDELGGEIASYPQVDKVLYWSSANITVYHKEQSIEVTCDFWKEPEKNENEFLLEGRLPEYDNEIVLTANICESIGAQTGDTVYVEGTSGRKDYILTGIDQKINNTGKKALMNYEGAERLNGSSMTKTIYIYGNESCTREELLALLSADYPDREMTDMERMLLDLLEPITSVIGTICFILIAVTVLMVILIVFLLIKTKLIRERKNYGISKALGFTTGQLCLQTLFSNLPVTALGALLGAELGRSAGGRLVEACLSTSGIRQCEIQTAPLWDVITVLLICLTAVAVTLLCCQKIKRIEPAEMLADE